MVIPKEIIDKLKPAINSNDANTIKEIFKANPGLEKMTVQFGLPLITQAANQKLLKMVKLLINLGVDVDEMTEETDTALIFASYAGSLQIVQALVKAGANINHQGYEGKTALFEASRQNQGQIVKYLMEQGADINIQDDSKKTALEYATMFKKKNSIKRIDINSEQAQTQNR